MKITLNWLREFVDIDRSASDVAEGLTMAGIEVESVQELRPVWSGVEISQVLEVAPHPNADRLRLCRVKTGSGQVAVVCGASNMAAGDKVALAVPGTLLPDGRRIERSTIRGQVSEGMLCSAVELELEGEEEGPGILILPATAPLGVRLVDYVGAEDTILEISVTPNRGDCLSVLGVARELAALTGTAFRQRSVSVTEDAGAASRWVRIEVRASDLCPRYCARVVRGLRVGRSPLWMRTRLAMAGLRSLGNVVDATNYVMLERGQPLHAFDLGRIGDSRVIVRRAESAQRYQTLDGAIRDLTPEDLIIADAKGPIALAGIIGGADSEIRDGTTDILLESAFFTPETVRRTARRLGLVTESSYRFERGVDPSGTIAALDRVTELILQCAGGSAARGVLERRERSRKGRRGIRLRPSRVNFLLGTDLSADEIAGPLHALGASVAGSARSGLRVVPPSYRFDLESEVDLVEEIARLRGYESVPASLPATPIGDRARSSRGEAVERVREALRAAGFNEMVTLAMVSAAENNVFPGPSAPASAAVALANPLSTECAEMRRSLIPGLLRALDENLRQGEPLVAAFSVGRTFAGEQGCFVERDGVALLLAGRWGAPEIGSAERPCSFADLKGALEHLFDALHISSPRWEPLGADAEQLHPGKAARILVDGVPLGTAGALHPALAANLGFKLDVWVAELDLERVLQYCPARVKFQQLARFPAVIRDVAIVADDDFRAQQVLDVIREAAHPLVEEVRVFDHYTGAPIPQGKKSLAYSISYRAPDRTLTDDEVNVLHESIVAGLLQSLPVEVRR